MAKASHEPSQEQRNPTQATSPDEKSPEAVEPGQDVSTEQDIPPNGGYGWVCVACAALINGHSWGFNSSFGVYLAHYLEDSTFTGATYLDFAFVGGLSFSVAMLVAPLATNTTRLFGTRVTLLVGVFFETLSFITASFAKELYQLFLSQGVCFAVGLGFLFVGSVGVVPQWFTTRRSFAQAIGAAGSGLGGMAYSFATNAAIQNISLAWAFRILGIVGFVVNFTCAILLKDRNKQVGTIQKAFDQALFKRFEFYMLLAWAFFSMLGYTVLIFSLPDYARSLGLSARQGSIISAIFNLGQAIGRPAIGLLSDRMGRVNMATFTTFLAGLFVLVIWIFSKTYGVLIFYAILGGGPAGAFWATVAPVSAEVVGLQLLPSALNLTWLTLVLPTTFAEAMALEIDQRSSLAYLGSQLFTGFMYIAAALCILTVRIWRIGQLEEEEEKLDDRSSDASSPRRTKKKSSPFGRAFTWKRV